MNCFLYTMAFLFAIDIFGKSIMLAKRNFERKENQMIFDILIGIFLLIWSVYLIAKLPN